MDIIDTKQDQTKPIEKPEKPIAEFFLGAFKIFNGVMFVVFILAIINLGRPSPDGAATAWGAMSIFFVVGIWVIGAAVTGLIALVTRFVP
ncbi:MAG: hypothetical protein COB93_02425 [Sneathiella sp.]|nr:MAG: hypothetical protein COB93_02425 [Sneathiella sp.]